VLKWARENGCPWNEDTRETALAEFGYADEYGNLVEDQWNAFAESESD